MDVDYRSTYVRVRDGTRIAVDVWQTATRHPRPAVLVPCRYWRATAGQDQLDPDLAVHAEQGFAVVLADVRGTGASYGTWTQPHSHREICDLRDVARWTRRQDWCTGDLAATGRSYNANDAELLLGAAVPGLRAVVADSPDHDLYRDLIFPGGIAATWFTDAWTTLIACLDGHTSAPPDTEIATLLAAGPRPVRGLLGRLHLTIARRQHRRASPMKMLPHDFCRDDVIPGTDVTLPELSTCSLDAIPAPHAPLLVRASWYDAATADGALRRWQQRRSPLTVSISATSHGGLFTADPFTPPAATSPAARAEETAQFLSTHLASHEGKAQVAALRMYTVGANTSTTLSRWPPHPCREQAWYLSPSHQLTAQPDASGTAERYEVDWTTTTGTNNRWHTQVGGGPVTYQGSDAFRGNWLRYTSQPLRRPLMLLGAAILELFLAVDAGDGAVYAALQYIDGTGHPRWLTDGQIRLPHRAGSFRRGDLLPVRAGEVMAVRVPLLPISALLGAGGQLLLCLAGHDAGSFARYPATGRVGWHLHLGGNRPSRLLTTTA